MRSLPLASFLAPGMRLGKYQLIRQLAIGGMAEVYLASAHGIEGFQKRVVLKRILPQYATSDDFVKMFLNEARIAATLDHPNIVAVYDIGSTVGNYFFTMEYVAGEDLRTILKTEHRAGRALPTNVALAIGRSIAAGLHYAHDKRTPEGRPLDIVHRDVSLSNILVSYDGAVKLVDFGVAKCTATESHTRAGTLKGKIAYMSPEQCRGEPLDRRSDVFALGIILYEMTTGTRLFNGDNEFAILQKIATTDVEPPSARVPSYPPELDAVIMGALRRDRNERYATAQELQAAIEGYALEHRVNTSPLEVASYMQRAFADRAAEAPDGSFSRPLRDVPRPRLAARGTEAGLEPVDTAMFGQPTSDCSSRDAFAARGDDGSIVIEMCDDDPLQPARAVGVECAPEPLLDLGSVAHETLPGLEAAAVRGNAVRSRRARLGILAAAGVAIAVGAGAALLRPPAERAGGAGGAEPAAAAGERAPLPTLNVAATGHLPADAAAARPLADRGFGDAADPAAGTAIGFEPAAEPVDEATAAAAPPAPAVFAVKPAGEQAAAAWLPRGRTADADRIGAVRAGDTAATASPAVPASRDATRTDEQTASPSPPAPRRTASADPSAPRAVQPPPPAHGERTRRGPRRLGRVDQPAPATDTANEQAWDPDSPLPPSS